MAHRLGLDIGTNSLGWCLLRLDGDRRPTGIVDLGVRIFHDSRDPKSGTSLTADRRSARSMRRRRDRYLQRRRKLMNALVRHGLMPADPKERKRLERLDPYELRARGLDEPLTLFELGRALFHLDQRRGFKSNRKSDVDEKEVGKVRQAVTELERRLAESGARTLGEFLYRRLRKGKTARARPGIGFYPSRAMYEAEFDALWATQAPHHPELTDAAREEIRDILFHQRRLKPVEPGNCELDPSDKRAPLALPLTQRFRMYQELNNLRLIMPDRTERRLTYEERTKLFDRLERQKTFAFSAMRKALGLDADIGFNLEDEKRKHLNGDQTGTVLASEDRFGPRWWELDEEAQGEIVEALLECEDEDEIAELAQRKWGLEADAAARLARVRLKQGYGRVGPRAMAAIMPIMRDQGLTYAEARKEAGYGDPSPPELGDALPYYGEVLQRHVSWRPTGDADPMEKEFGRLANPTVHVGLNQLRKLVNALIAEYGRPDQIVVELARELKFGRQRKREIQQEQAANTRRNERIASEIEALGQPVTGENIRRYKLWEDLGEVHDRRCVYTGEVISGRMLFSDEVEVEHILPFQQSLDDSMANRILCLRRGNRDKGDRSPHEAFGHNPPGYDYDAILKLAAGLPRNKRWRFAPDAMERWEKEGGFIARQLTDTAYLAKATKEYLGHICNPDDVWVIPGRLTALLRGKWGLNSLLSDANFANVAIKKNRKDHRHHVIDAAVIGVTDRGLLQRVATAAEQSRERLIDDMPEPWDGFRDDLRDRLGRTVVSHKPDHGVGGQLHEETAYGILDDPENWDDHTLVFRKPLVGLTEGEMKRIRDAALRKTLIDHVDSEKVRGRPLKQAQESFRWPEGTDKHVRHVRLLKKEAKFISVNGVDGKPYKALIPGGNHHVDIFELPNGRWAGEGVSVFDANRPGFTPKWCRKYPDARLVMRIHKGDLLRLGHEGEERVMRVVKLSPANDRLLLCENLDSGDLQKRHDDPDDPFQWAQVSFNQLKVRRARKVSVDILGRVKDPGPRK